MRIWPVGSKVWVIGNCNGHGYTVGRAYVVVEVDDDGTFRARDVDSGTTGNWMRWQDVDIRPPIGWDFCKSVLAPDVVRFLEAFDGIESIILSDTVKHRLLNRLPGLQQAITAAAEEVATERPEAGELPARPTRATEDAVLRFFLDAEDSEQAS